MMALASYAYALGRFIAWPRNEMKGRCMPFHIVFNIQHNCSLNFALLLFTLLLYLPDDPQTTDWLLPHRWDGGHGIVTTVTLLTARLAAGCVPPRVRGEICVLKIVFFLSFFFTLLFPLNPPSFLDSVDG